MTTTVPLKVIRELDRIPVFQGVVPQPRGSERSLQRLWTRSPMPWRFIRLRRHVGPLHADIFLMFASKNRGPQLNLLQGVAPSLAASDRSWITSRAAVARLHLRHRVKEVQLPTRDGADAPEVSALPWAPGTGSG